MIVAAVDDLMFASKISTAARQLGVEVVFARSEDQVLERVRTLKPALTIFDLDSRQTRPLSTIAAMKADPELSSMRTLGFVSHVHGELIARARQAGIDEVLARSAFSSRLPEILGV